MTTNADYTITAYNAEGESLSLRPHHATDYEALCAEGHEVGPFSAGDALSYVAEAGRTGARLTNAGDHVVQPVATYRLWAVRAPGHFEEHDAPKTSTHSTCTHANTKADRARCRAAKKGN